MSQQRLLERQERDNYATFNDEFEEKHQGSDHNTHGGTMQSVFREDLISSHNNELRVPSLIVYIASG